MPLGMEGPEQVLEPRVETSSARTPVGRRPSTKKVRNDPRGRNGTRAYDNISGRAVGKAKQGKASPINFDAAPWLVSLCRSSFFAGFDRASLLLFRLSVIGRCPSHPPTLPPKPPKSPHQGFSGRNIAWRRHPNALDP